MWEFLALNTKREYLTLHRGTGGTFPVIYLVECMHDRRSSSR